MSQTDQSRPREGGPSNTDTPRVPQSLESLAAALVALQARLPRIEKSERAVVESQRGKYTYSYANLAQVTRALYPGMTEVGLAFTAYPTLREDGHFVLRYALVHPASGEERGGDFPLPANAAPQLTGSIISYARRYSLMSAVGAVSEDDDDDAVATRPAVESEPRKRPARRTGQSDEPRLITDQQGKLLHKLLTDAGMPKREDYLPYLSSKLSRPVTTTKSLTVDEAGIAIDLLQQALAEPHEETPGGVA
ncbi:MAG TPA: ERF family protein [Micromonosporaceae bacterium]|nr:ERF family protein [Micromonosporaceae bacterium]